MKSLLYFEAHITCDAAAPYDSVSIEDSWQDFCYISKLFDWKASKFDQDDVDGYHDKWFMSARGYELEGVKKRVKETIESLSLNGFNVIRWKIEDTILDSKHGDTLE